MSEAQAVKLGREYETIYVLKPDVSKENAERIANRVVEVVGREGGKLTQVENWGRRQLAYPIAKQRRGYYVCLKYVGGGGLVSELERNFRLLDDVIRYQTVKTQDEIDLGGVEVKAEDVEFEAVEPLAEAEPEESLARRLGLEDLAYREDLHRNERHHAPVHHDDDGDDEGVGGSDDGEDA